MVSRALMICLCVSLLSIAHGILASAADSDARGTIDSNNDYRNTVLQIEIPLPGRWHFFDREMYSSREKKQKTKEQTEQDRKSCRGPFCGEAEVDVALQTDEPFLYAIFLTARPLPVEYQNRERYPLKMFAQAFTSRVRENFVPEGELTEITLAGKPAFRINLHHTETTTAKGFAYVAESNGRIFMLLGTAMKDPEKLRVALERMDSQNKPN